ncbi:hypothetical protein M406DRAFT_343786 [Cryphonectria parasitica EP155]|uniref:Uncharacterized protein n=1 Tax=Cryphonectria parasitica (strain ATCC 38755 / EP155) TaxID=660469 RepID=A0A9P5CTP1_CRYP1|nr:uncharacterized protein M406DRAFT_343786 [Cryphonectria parasitica EP155]KAF3769641.1 hypothetical protein M406DRAFT_343786 [Cryphonectria parasitica EP155]
MSSDQERTSSLGGQGQDRCRGASPLSVTPRRPLPAATAPRYLPARSPTAQEQPGSASTFFPLDLPPTSSSLGYDDRNKTILSSLHEYHNSHGQGQVERIPSPETTPKRLVRGSTPGPTDNVPKSAGPATAPSRLSLLTMFARNTPPSITPEMHDELLNMKVDEALFPAGAPTGKDTFSPAAFKNLQAQATGLLTKMQSAYRQKAQALSELEKEREADRDELDEAETRSKHLKFQLEDMAHKAAEQEQRMKQLMEELATERRARAELERLGAFSKQRLSPGGLASEAGSTISEDLGVDEEEMQKRKWRKSNGTDTSFETDDDSISFEGESVFSRPRSPSVSTTTTTRGVETGSVIDMPIPTPTSMRGPNSTKRTSVQSNRPRSQMSTFQKLMKGISGEDGCRNCKGQDSSSAWDTVSLLRDENKNLKQRVGELEDCLEGALDAVNGVGL